MILNNIQFKKIKAVNRPAIRAFITKHWGSELVVVHDTKYYPAELDGFCVFDNKRLVGLVTYMFTDNKCEIITLNSIIEKQGIGTRLMAIAENEARLNNCNKIWLVTTNDNIEALKFYQKLGYRITKVNKGAVERARKIKNEIPQFSANGIELKDELELEKDL